MVDWEIIAKKLSASGLSLGCSSEIDGTRRVLYTADAYPSDYETFTTLGKFQALPARCRFG